VNDLDEDKDKLIIKTFLYRNPLSAFTFQTGEYAKSRIQLVQDIINKFKEENTLESKRVLAHAYYSLAGYYFYVKDASNFNNIKSQFEKDPLLLQCNDRRHEKMKINFALLQAKLERKKKNYVGEFREYLKVYQSSSTVIKNESFIASYKKNKNLAEAKMISILQTLLKSKNYKIAAMLVNEAKQAGFIIERGKFLGFKTDSLLEKKELSKLSYGEALNRKQKYYKTNQNLEAVLTQHFSDSYTASFLARSTGKGAGIGVIFLGAGLPFGVLIGLGHGIFTAITRKPISIADQKDLPAMLKKFANMVVNNKKEIIANIISKYQKACNDSSSNSDSSLYLHSILQVESSLPEKWAAIDSYMLEPYDRTDPHNKLLNNNGKKMFKIIYDEINHVVNRDLNSNNVVPFSSRNIQ
jgi:hypothetical protein